MDIIQTQMISIGSLSPNTGQIKGLPKNPRFIKDDRYHKLKQSIADNPEMLALRELVVVPHKRGFVTIGGNMRLRACMELGYKEMPCKVVPSDMTVDQMKAFVIKDNVGFGAWDIDDLANEWDIGDLDDWGLDDVLSQLDKEGEGGAGEGEGDGDAAEMVDKAEELNQVWQCESGQLWQIGEHRLIIGDCTDAATVARLMGGELADLTLTDPPYGVSYADKNQFLNEFDKGNKVQSEIENDHLGIDDIKPIWLMAFTNAYDNSTMKASFYSFMPQGGDQMMMMMMMMSEAGWMPKHELIWLKNNHVLGRTDYAYKHEPIIYGWKRKGSHVYYGGFQTSVFAFDKPNKSELHPTMKPIQLISKLIENSTMRGQLVLDPFCGSGTTLIAAQQTGRKCYGCEIEPKYGAVILERLKRAGLTPKLVI